LGDFGARGILVQTTNNVSGPVTAGFDPSNRAVPTSSTAQGWVSLDNPAGLNISGQITLESWINAAATQTDPARIVSHGPPTPTFVTDPTLVVTNGNMLGGNEVFLRIEGGTSYAVGTSDGTNFHGVKAAVPAGDLGGGNWVHLVGTYDGAKWNLYRNGQLLGSAPDAVGAVPVNGAEWAIGSTGMGWGDFFAGSIDETAIYSTALNASQVAAHYAAASSASSGAVRITITHSGNNVTLTWPSGTLQKAESVTGNFTDLNPATSPYTVPANGNGEFYRVKVQ
jgi:hypothetical protein